MPDTIRDGTGTGKLARVNGDNRLFVNSVITDEAVDANIKGRAYNLNTGNITLTNDAETPVFYIKNNQDGDMHIKAIAIGIKASTGATLTQAEVTFTRNPTSGTIISGATDVDIESNRNYGSADSLTVDAYKGATGLTMTGDTDHIFIYAGTVSRSYIAIDEILPKGTSFGVKITPPSGNTSLTLYVAAILHMQTVEG